MGNTLKGHLAIFEVLFQVALYIMYCTYQIMMMCLCLQEDSSKCGGANSLRVNTLTVGFVLLLLHTVLSRHWHIDGYPIMPQWPSPCDAVIYEPRLVHLGLTSNGVSLQGLWLMWQYTNTWPLSKVKMTDNVLDVKGCCCCWFCLPALRVLGNEKQKWLYPDRDIYYMDWVSLTLTPPPKGHDLSLVDKPGHVRGCEHSY